MVGVQNPFTPISIPGRLAYLTSGNAWLMEGSTANRRPIVTSGDLDGRIFSISPDGRWLLYTRKSNQPADQEINSLWVSEIADTVSNPIDLHVSNIIHFADWIPGEDLVIAYSTVEPRATPPGWQANNDLFFMSFDAEKSTASTPEQILDSTSGGIYGWWGTDFFWSTDGKQLAFSRPDTIGYVDIENHTLKTLKTITPFNTFADWAWIPGLTWGIDNNNLYFIDHVQSTGLGNPEESPSFNLSAISLLTDISMEIAPQTGMFAYPAVSPSSTDDMAHSTDSIAYMQSIFPSQSATSRYRLSVMDSDGSENSMLFPNQNQTGLEPQTPVWAPSTETAMLAIHYEGNLWIIDVTTRSAQQVTGDGLISKLDWK
jgi:resuscitation-promoting factor RpfB